MSEPTAARGVVLAHGDLAAGFVDAVRQISGVEEGALEALSNRGLSPEALLRELERRTADGPTFIFTDLPSGSCCFAARRLSRERPDIIVITGVNLPLLLDFVLHRTLPPSQLAARLVEKGRAGIGSVPIELEGDARRTLSRG